MARTEHNNTDPNGARRAERLAERDARMAHAEEVARMRAAEAGGDELDEMFAAHEVRDEFEAEAEAEAAASVADVEERAEAERAAEVAYHEARRAERATAGRIIPDPLHVYLVLGSGPAVRYATTNRRAAVAAAERFADEDAARRPNDATPHYVVQVWRTGEREDTLHVYASRNGAPNPMSTATARELDEPDTGAYLRPEELAAEQTDNDDEVAALAARREAELEWAARPAPVVDELAARRAAELDELAAEVPDRFAGIARAEQPNDTLTVRVEHGEVVATLATGRRFVTTLAPGYLGRIDDQLAQWAIVRGEWLTTDVSTLEREARAYVPNIPEQVTSTDAEGHLRDYRVVGMYPNGKPRTSSWDAIHADRCRCTTDPESWH